MGHGAWGMGLPGVLHKPAICCITHSQERTPCRFPKINRAMVISIIEARELFWGRETARCGVQSGLGRDFCELIYAVDED